MVSNVTNSPKTDILIWILAISMVIAGLSSHLYFEEQSLLLRVIGLIAAFSVAAYLSTKTSAGKMLIKYWQEALFELRKVIWPTKKETMQSTIAVLAMVVVMGLILWSVDAVLMAFFGKLLT